MVKVALTGGIASGKSLVARLMVNCGAHLIDADALAKKAVRPDSEVWRAIVRTFGGDIVKRNREIDRLRLGSLIFSNAPKRQQLNAIIHPWIYAEYQRRANILAKDYPNGVLIFDIPLLFETKMQRYFDHIIVAYVDKETQIRRIIKRDHLRRFEALERINSQFPLLQKRRDAGYVFDTRIPLEDLRREVQKAYNTLQLVPHL